MSEENVVVTEENEVSEPVVIGGVEFTEKEFGQPGRREKGTEAATYKARQLTETSINNEDGAEFLEDALKACEGDVGRLRDSFIVGWNRTERLSAGGFDEYQKAAKGFIKLAADSGFTKMGWVKGLSIDEVAEKIKAMEG